MHVFDAGSGTHVAAYPGHRDQVGFECGAMGRRAGVSGIACEGGNRKGADGFGCRMDGGAKQRRQGRVAGGGHEQ